MQWDVQQEKCCRGHIQAQNCQNNKTQHYRHLRTRNSKSLGLKDVYVKRLFGERIKINLSEMMKALAKNQKNWLILNCVFTTAGPLVMRTAEFSSWINIKILDCKINISSKRP